MKHRIHLVAFLQWQGFLEHQLMKGVSSAWFEIEYSDFDCASWFLLKKSLKSIPINYYRLLVQD